MRFAPRSLRMTAPGPAMRPCSCSVSYLVALGLRLTRVVAELAVLLYEYLITFDREVSYAWGRRLTLARAPFFLNRYTALLQYSVQVLSTLLPQTFFVRSYLLMRIVLLC